MNELSADVLRLKGSVVRRHSEYIVTRNLTTMSNFTSELKHAISKKTEHRESLQNYKERNDAGIK